MKLFGIIGWKHNGKTTLVEKLLINLTQRGYKVSSVKHAHHQLDLDEKGRDSFRHRQAGASETLLATSQRWALLHEYRDQSESKLSVLTPHFSPCDLLLVEGYKYGDHPKIEVVRQLNSQGLLFDQVPNVTAIATDLKTIDTNAFVLDLNCIDSITDWVLAQLNIHSPQSERVTANQQPLGADTSIMTNSMSEHSSVKQAAPINIIKQESITGSAFSSDNNASLINAGNNDCYSPSQGLLSAKFVWQAMEKVTTNSQQTQLNTSPLNQCYNRYLGANLNSIFDSPRFDNAAVDGWAIRYQDLVDQQYQLTPMNTQASAGDKAKLTLQKGHCLRISTGARLPKGADTIVMQEDVSITSDQVVFPTSVIAGSNWRKQGEDITKGACILTKGTLLRPQDIGLAAATGYASLPVHHPVKVALFSTGNEVHEVGQALPENGIYDVNRHMLQALFADLHCEVSDLGILKDDYDTIYQSLQLASQSHQLIVTSGGASTGTHDHIAKALAALGEVKAWRVAIKPGRPLAFGTIGKALFLGLPGNPVAANVCSLVFGAPLVGALQSGQWQQPKPFLETIGFDVKKQTGRREWLRVYRELQDDGTILLKRSASHGSGVLTSLTKAHGLVELDESISYIHSGEKVRFFPFSGFGIGQLD